MQMECTVFLSGGQIKNSRRAGGCSRKNPCVSCGKDARRWFERGVFLANERVASIELETSAPKTPLLAVATERKRVDQHYSTRSQETPWVPIGRANRLGRFLDRIWAPHRQSRPFAGLAIFDFCTIDDEAFHADNDQDHTDCVKKCSPHGLCLTVIQAFPTALQRNDIVELE